MLYSDFIIFKEHKFLRNIFSIDELAKTNSLKDLKAFHEKFVSFLKIVVLLQNALNTNEDLDDCFNDNLLDFCRNCCADCSDFNEIKDLINDVELKTTETDPKFPNSRYKLMLLFIRD